MISSQEVVERALRQILKSTGLTKDQIERMLVTAKTSLAVIVNDALELMAKRVAEGDAYEGLQQDFDVTPTAGFLDLTSQTQVLFDINRTRLRIAATGATVRACDSYETLEHGGLPLDQVWYAQDGSGLRFRDTSGSLTAYATALKMRANYIPSFTTAAYPIPDQLRATLVSTAVELGSGVVAEAVELAQTGRA